LQCRHSDRAPKPHYAGVLIAAFGVSVNPPFPELLEARHSLVVGGAAIATISICGGVAGYVWARRQRRRPAGDRRDPAALKALLERIEQTERAATAQPEAMTWVSWLLLGGIVLSFVDMFAFLVISLWIGGDAVSGRAADGRFFVSSHGHLTEVTELVFKYSLWHTRLVQLNWALLFGVAALVAVVARVRNRSKGR
jgi:hypothetical protein